LEHGWSGPGSRQPLDLVVTVDTEGDNQWDHGAVLGVQNADYWEAFQQVCARHGVRPTYLITSEIANDERAAGLLSSWAAAGDVEVGAHLHPWTTPPFVDRPGLRFNDPAHAFPHELPGDLLDAKLDVLTAEIDEAIGRRPTSFRAGRFGFDHRCALALLRLGYEVDSSVTPGVSWATTSGLPGGAGGPDFTGHSSTPFLIEGAGPQALLELPVTILSTHAWTMKHPAFLPLTQGRPARLLRRLTPGSWPRPQPLWLRPTVLTGRHPLPWRRRDGVAVRLWSQAVVTRDMEAVWRQAEIQRLPSAVMMFHSSELMPGGSPFFPDRTSVQELLRALDSFFSFARGRGARFATLTEAARAIRTVDDVVVKQL
jgi:hypothetical protein